MSDLVRTLIIGFFTSLILILLAWWFWRLYDRPSKKQLEIEGERKEKSKEIRMWRAVEAQMQQEEAEVEAEIEFQKLKAEERAKEIPPPSGVVMNAFATLDTPTDAEAFNERFKPKEMLEDIEVEDLIEQIQENDSDVLLAPDLVEVRQGDGVESQDLLLQLQMEGAEENNDQEIIETAPSKDKQEQSEEDDEKPIVDEKTEWDQKDEPLSDDPWDVGW